MIGRIARGALLGLLTALTVGVWPAGATLSNVRVTKPIANQVLSGTYSSSGTPSGFVEAVQGTATTNCSSGFASVRFTITGPSSYSKPINMAPPADNGTFTFNTTWDTQDLRNGLYRVRLDVVDDRSVLLSCNGEAGSAYVDNVKVANPPQAPVWDGSPTAAGDGSAKVTLAWKRNPELDVSEYRILRSGGGSNVEAVVSASNPGEQFCTLESGTYTCTDTSFPDSYSGDYVYSITAWRSRPAYNSSESPKPECSISESPCVQSGASDARQVTLTQPTPSPSPTPTDTPTGTTPPTNTPGPGGNTPNTSGTPRRSTTGVLSFGGSRTSSGPRPDFYSGTYSETLPYGPQTLIVGGARPTSPGRQDEAASMSSEPPDYRTIMLPVAGGLLAFLSAAHVRRLLVRF